MFLCYTVEFSGDGHRGHENCTPISFVTGVIFPYIRTKSNRPTIHDVTLLRA
jgi:hypothetical protein